MGSRVPPAVTTTCLSSSERDRCRSAPARAKISSGSAIRPTPTSPSARSPLAGPTISTPRARSRLEVGLRRRVLPHPRVHRGRDEQRAVVREHRLGERVVGETVRQARHRVRRQRRDDEQVGALKVRIRIGRRGRAGERVERLGGDESLGTARRQRQDVVPGTDEEPDDLARLVGGDAAGDPEDDARHRHSLPVTGRKERGADGYGLGYA